MSTAYLVRNSLHRPCWPSRPTLRPEFAIVGKKQTTHNGSEQFWTMTTRMVVCGRRVKERGGERVRGRVSGGKEFATSLLQKRVDCASFPGGKDGSTSVYTHARLLMKQWISMKRLVKAKKKHIEKNPSLDGTNRTARGAAAEAHR